jgi:hypothetical protein
MITNPKTGVEVASDLADYDVSELATVIRNDWDGQRGVNYAARPYLDAMHSLTKVSDNYGADRGDMIVAYFLSNASSWRGPIARAVKAELRKRIA